MYSMRPSQDISPSSFSSLEGSGGAAGASSSAGFSSLARAVFTALTNRNTTSAISKKSMMVAIKLPMPTTTASFTTVSPCITAGERVILRAVRSISPMTQPKKGMNTSLTSDEVILPKAPPTMTPTAISITLPREMNSRNSFAIFFMQSPFAPAHGKGIR